MSTISKRDKRKNKKKYFQSKKQKIGRSLEAGLKGFLITCNNEPQCVKEAYNVLNEFADSFLGPVVKKEDDASESSNDDDVEDQLAKEIQMVKEEKKRFQQMSTKVKGIIFIQTTIDDPTSLVNAIFDDVLQTGKRKARYILKFLPVVETCKASEEDIQKSVTNYLINFVSIKGNDVLTYKIDPKVRHNSNITSSHILSYLRGVFEKCVPLWKVSMLNPDVVVSVTILKSVCCISFLKNYMNYKKYNLSEVANVSRPPDSQPALTNKTDVKEKSGVLDEEISSDLHPKLTNVASEDKKESDALE
ncbi:THUMP domain-containing protein 1 [Parasteatoda tepidariorum]|uniref:THUMP domain-containing protein 1 n=1 Tax=Parasteatoda tepidariorum TaxID=114398 RepID=UPI00077FC0C5|nr:THUMP domain-containing protein 1 [Parasteatoda tepidariorum]XP_042905322.1 THUMP domain-containing protein 1 [Parasteatoda tepidariorum]